MKTENYAHKAYNAHLKKWVVFDDIKTVLQDGEVKEIERKRKETEQAAQAQV